MTRTLVLAVLSLTLLPGCTLYQFDGGMVVQRSTAELQEISTAQYTILFTFVAVAALTLLLAATPGEHGTSPLPRVVIALFATLVALLLAA